MTPFWLKIRGGERYSEPTEVPIEGSGRVTCRVAYETAECVKSYLDFNQLGLEQMCLAVLARDRAETVRPLLSKILEGHTQVMPPGKEKRRVEARRFSQDTHQV